MKNTKINASQGVEANDLKISYFDLSGPVRTQEEYAARIRDIIKRMKRCAQDSKQSNESIQILIFPKPTRHNHE